MIKKFRREFYLNDGDKVYPPVLERSVEDAKVTVEIDGDGNLVFDTEVGSSIIIYYIPTEAMVELINIHAKFVNEKKNKK